MNYVKQGETPLSYVLVAIQICTLCIHPGPPLGWQPGHCLATQCCWTMSFGMFMLLTGPARGRKPEQLVLAQLLVKIVSPPLTAIASLRWEEVDPPRDVQLTAFVKGTGFRIWPSPGSSGFWFVKCAQLRAPCKGSSSNIQQGWWGVYLTQRRAVQKGLSSNTPQLVGKTEPLQLRAVCKKVDPKISLISVRERSTNCNRLQSSQAAGPIQVKSAGRCNETIPASKKQHSGRQRVKFAGFFLHVSRGYVCRLCTSHLRLVKEGEVNRPTGTGKQTNTQPNKPQNHSNQARHGSLLERLRQPEIGETDIYQAAMNSSLALSSSSSEKCTITSNEGRNSAAKVTVMGDKGGETIALHVSVERQRCQALGSRHSMHGGRKVAHKTESAIII